MEPPPKFASFIAITSLFVSILLHVASFVPSFALTWRAAIPPLILSAFSLMTAGMLASYFCPTSPSIRTGRLFQDWLNVEGERWRYNARARATVSRPWKIGLLLVLLYMAFSFGSQVYQTRGGVPIADKYGYSLTAPGRGIRTPSQEEYLALKALELRTFSCLPMLFSCLAFVGTFVVYPKIAHEILTENQKHVRDIK